MDFRDKLKRKFFSSCIPCGWVNEWAAVFRLDRHDRPNVWFVIDFVGKTVRRICRD